MDNIVDNVITLQFLEPYPFEWVSDGKRHEAFIDKEAVRRIGESSKSVPLRTSHDGDDIGTVFGVFYDENDNWLKGYAYIENVDILNKIKNGEMGKVSAGFTIDESTNGYIRNHVKYDINILNGTLYEVALVEDPNLEEARVINNKKQYVWNQKQEVVENMEEKKEKKEGLVYNRSDGTIRLGDSPAVKLEDAFTKYKESENAVEVVPLDGDTLAELAGDLDISLDKLQEIYMALVDAMEKQETDEMVEEMPVEDEADSVKKEEKKEEKVENSKGFSLKKLLRNKAEMPDRVMTRGQAIAQNMKKAQGV